MDRSRLAGRHGTGACDPETRKKVANRFKGRLVKIDDEIKALIEETLRLHPEEFTQLPGGGWISNEWATKH
jgi:hypothetical protein